ncbi:hypothetical protein [Nocardia yamanashiensis]|uniref:hypothetical protein n=1 Tax=Nocardia yamanashiensis TaxID=209247 RepID=UPI0012FD6F8B|nr:hypothetical protein [Nocardia yamanashiensis]
MRPVGIYREMYEGRRSELPALSDAVAGFEIADRERVLDYMRAAPGIFDVLDVVTDLVDNIDQIMSASSLVSDGTWIWRVDSIHYLGKYDLEIPADFLHHVRRSEYSPPASIEFTSAVNEAIARYF